MKLVAMEREPEPMGLGTPTEAYKPNPYPYGLRINLTHEELEKLGYSELPPAGTECRIEAVGVVVRSATEDPDADGDVDYCCVELQITEMGMEQEGVDEEDAEESDGERNERRAHSLYGKKEETAA